jgi:BON domain
MRLLLRCGLSLGVTCGLLLGVGCRQKNNNPESPAATSVPAQPQAAPPNDQQIRAGIQAKINGESALDARNIHVHVQGGVVTLNGSVANDASRALAAAESGSVDGVRTVINNLNVVPGTMAQAGPRPAPKTAAKPRRQAAARENPQSMAETTPAPAPPSQPPPQQEQVQTIAPPPPPPPPPPPKPVVKTVTLAAGAVIPVRMTDTLNSGSTETDTVFHGSLAADLIVDGMVAAPRGSTVIGKVVSAKKAGHFSGGAELDLQLTSIYVHDREIPVVTATYTKQGPGRGKNTALKTGGGAVLGALIGAAAGGGKGAAIGAATGAGAGTAVNGVTRGKEVQIPAEALVNFNLQTPISLTTSKVAGQSISTNSSSNDNGPVLKRAPQE